jgi:FkbM family methyltransferase
MTKYILKLKVFVAKILANNITGNILSFLLNQRIPFHNLSIDVSDKAITPETKALIFFKIYEKAEITFVKKYLQEEEDVIELGSSIGVMGSIISLKQKNAKYISVEANPALINANKKNLSINRKAEYVLLNKAIDYSDKSVSFSVNKNNLTGKVSREASNEMTITVETVTLNELCDIYNLTGFTLVSDIEGAEIAILINDKVALKKCEKIIIELHDTEYNGKTYLVKDLVDLIINCDFKISDHHGAVYVFRK